MEVVELYWYPPVKLDYDSNEPCYYIAQDNLELPYFAKQGWYQIYADHPLYGRDSLVYIGMTDDSFNRRLNSHLNNFIGYHTNISVRLCCADEADLQSHSIHDIESLLIASHMPALNQTNLHIPNNFSNDLMVLNLGEAGDLMPVISSALFSKS